MKEWHKPAPLNPPHKSKEPQPDLLKMQTTIVLEHSLRLGRLADMLELLHDMLIDDMPEHPEAEHIRALSFAAIDVARIAEQGIGRLTEILVNRESTSAEAFQG